MRFYKLIPICLFAALAAGCGEPKLDGKSEQSFKDSMEKMTKGMSVEQKEQLQKNVMTVAMGDISLGDIMAGRVSADQQINKIRTQLDGKTAKDVSAQADKVRAAREEKEKQQALQEIKELQETKALAERDRKELEKFEVLKSRFYIKEDKYGISKQPIIELSVKNGTTVPVSRAYFKGTIASPGRSVPWLTDTFNYKVRGGLEPGETGSWDLAPNMFSDWGKVDAPQDAVFTVEVYRIDGPDEKPAFNAEGLSESKQKRLESLSKKYLVN